MKIATTLFLCFCWAVAWEAPARAQAAKTALDEYVHAPDPHYEYRLVSTLPGPGYTGYVLEMVSQAWLTEEEVDRPVWRHWMTVVKPDQVKSRTGFLFIGGGSNRDPAPGSMNDGHVQIALASQTVVAELKMVPNQPLVFNRETGPLYEDALVAYTWDKFLRTGDEKWPARLPMTKAALRAMDTITAFCAAEERGGNRVDQFVVAGGSKRGWTTWTAAAVDKRVVAAVPLVIDLLNLEPSFIHHYEAYGFYAPAVRDYVAKGIMDWQGTPEFTALMKLVEPYEYRERLTMPKFIINATGDQFFLPDSWKFYFHDLPEPKFLRYVPNADHSLRNTDALESVTAFYLSVLSGSPMPRFKWEDHEDGSIRVTARDRPLEARLWQATNPEARDFRVDTIGRAWTSSVLEEEEPGVYVARVQGPENGWRAYMVELTFPTRVKLPLKLTTGVRVIPDILPHTYEPPRAPGTTN